MEDILFNFKKNNEYSNVLNYSKENNNISFKQFDEDLLNKIYLFDVPNDEFFSQIDIQLNKIIKVLPSIKKILSKPIVYLKDKQEIVPVEAVKVINNQTLAHVAIHTELWNDITKEGIKPRKLMTIEKIENYVIYENIVVTRVINSILDFIKKTILLMKDILYGCQDIHFNMLDRTHHKQYFLAIGKLHMEYASAHERHYSLYFSCIEKLMYIEKTLTSKLKAPLYQLCNKNKSKIKLKKTNVFRSHKDYKNIYEIAKLFETNLESKNDNNIELDIKTEQYSNFVNLLLIFAIGHFNFKFKENEKFDFFNLNNDCSYNNWNLNIKNISENNIYGIKLTFNKDKQYSICIIYNNVSDVSDNDIQVFKEKNKANEYLFTSYEKYGKKDILYLSIYDVDSFRRLQQLLLKGMVYSDTTHDICPFCGSKLVDKEGIYECNICRGQIYEKTCPKTNNKYYVTTIKKYTSYANTNTNQKEKRKFLHDRYSDARLHFRNITPLSIDGTLLCSECGLKHN